jgi:Flp pilus assembly protein TadG
MRAAAAQLWSFYRREHGSISVLFGLLSFVLFAAIGAAVDYGRWHSANQRIETVIDDALLAAGRQYQTDPNAPELAIAAAQAYFNQAVANGLDIETPAATFAIVQSPMGLSGTVTGRVTTPFLGMMKVANLPIYTSAQVEFGVAGGGGGGSGNSTIEVSLMLDVTESMCDGGTGPCTSSAKMDALKSASKDLVNIVTASNISQTVARVALVPFSGRVRIAPENTAQAGTVMKALTNLDPAWSGHHADCTGWSGGTSTNSESWGTGSTCDGWVTTHVNNWKILPCVTDRTGPDEFTDKAPSGNAWLNGSDGNRSPVSWDSSDTPQGSELGVSNTDPSYGSNYSSDGQCWDLQPANVILPLTADKATINARIDALDAYGPTGGALGTAWAWYMLSPNWSGIWTGQNTPGPYSDLSVISSSGVPKLRKIAVLMTDGDYNTYRGWKDEDPVMVANNAKQICANMKAEGVEVFTVGFDLDSLPAAEKARAIDTLQTCGTDIQHFYNSLDPAQLKTSFRDIALKLSQLYLSR